MGELPQETICAIASYLDKHDLRNFSLISRAFVAESQRQLFRTVVFSHYFHFLRWCKVITHGHPIIPSYIRVFIIFFSTWFSGPPTKNESDCYIMASRVFASFPNLEEIFLRSLTLRYPHQFSMVSNFCASAQSVRSLRIEASQCSPGLMTKFICLFPQLDDIHMEMVNATDGEPYDLPTPSPSFRGRGRITLAGDYCQHLRFLPLRFKYLYLTSFLFKPRGLPVEHNVSVLNDFIIICSPTLEHLTLCVPEMARETETGQAVDLSPCTRLRTLRIELRELSKCHPHLIQLLASLKSSTPYLETIALVFYSSGMSLTDGLRRFGDEWDPVDTQLCRLAELKGGGLCVSVGFNGFRMRQGTPLLGAFMAKFRCSPHTLTILCDSSVVTLQD